MKIVACVKTVKDELVDQQTATGEYTLNPYDLFALNSILTFRKEGNHELCCVTMGGSQIRGILEKCYAVGVDEIMWLNDIKFAGADTVATTVALSKAIEQISDCKLIVCGEKAVDGETGQVPPGLAQRLGMQFIGGVKNIRELTEEYIIVETEGEKENNLIKATLPAVIAVDEFTTVMEHINLLALKKARKREIPIYTAESLGLAPEDCGLKGSKTSVVRTEPNIVQKEIHSIEGTIEEKVQLIATILKK